MLNGIEMSDVCLFAHLIVDPLCCLLADFVRVINILCFIRVFV